jgi:hypothetical protein
MNTSQRLLVLALALVGAAATAPAAEAANTTTISQSADQYTVRTAQDGGDNARPGLRNKVTVTESAEGGLQIRDAGVGVTVVAQAPCSLIDADTAVCPEDPEHNATLEITSGGGDDIVNVDLPERPLAGLAAIRVYGGYGADSISGSEGNDTLEGDARHGDGSAFSAIELQQLGDGGPDVISGRGGRDTLRGQGGNDYLNGGTIGAPTIDGANTLDGGSGDDFFDAGATLGPDHFTGGTNNGPSANPDPIGTPGLPNSVQADVRGGDTVSYATRTYTTGGSTGVTADLDGVADDGTTGGNEGDQIDADVEALVGTIRDDKLTGSTGRNDLTGQLGVDTLAGGGAADRFFIRDGVRDKCVQPGDDDTVDADLQDPTPDECAPTKVLTLFSFTFTSKPVDETIPYVEVGTLKRTSSGRLQARITCAKDSKKACTGDLRVQSAKGGKSLAVKHFKAKRGRTTTVTLSPSEARLAALRQAGAARLLAVSQGTSKKGPTTTQVQRPLR